MKILKYVFLAFFSFAACQSEPSKTVTTPEKEVNMDSKKTLVVPWNVQIDESTHELKISRDPAADMANLQPADIVDALNLKYPEIKLQWVKLDGDKAFVSIADATYLTQQAGSEGAQAYLAEATYSLTELKEIAAVEFAFEEGDHARPGVYKRTDFKF